MTGDRQNEPTAPVHPGGERWIVDGGDGCTTGFDTEAEAVAYADACIQDWCDEGWMEEVDNIFVARLTHRSQRQVVAVQGEVSDEEWERVTHGGSGYSEWWEYTIEPVGSTPQAPTAETPTAPAPVHPGGWVPGIGWVALLPTLPKGTLFRWTTMPDREWLVDPATMLTEPDNLAVIVTRWADGSTPQAPTVDEPESDFGYDGFPPAPTPPTEDELGPWCCYAGEVGHPTSECSPENPIHAPTHCGYDNVRRGLVPAPPTVTDTDTVAVPRAEWEALVRALGGESDEAVACAADDLHTAFAAAGVSGE